MASIEKRGNSYRIIVSKGYDIYNNKLREQITYTPDPKLTPKQQQKALQAFAVEFEQKVLNGINMDSRKITLKEFAERWLSEYASQKLQPGTVAKYTYDLNEKLLPALGHYKLSELKPHIINSFLVSMTKDGVRKDGKPGGYSKGSITKLNNTLSSVLRTAVEWEILDHNPCDRVRTHGEDTAERIKFFDADQVISFLKFIEQPYEVAVKGHRRVDDTGVPYLVDDYTITKEMPEQLRILLILAVYTGLRKGEIVALQWSDIDFDKETLSVKRSVSVVNGEPMCKSPKTKNSIRTIAIPHFLMERLAKWKSDQSSYQQSLGDYWQGNNWIFIQSNGKMMNYSTPYETLRDAITRYNKDKPEEQALPMIPFHGLRHTSATLLIASNQDLKTVSRRMGHAQTSTTMNIYAHALRECDRNASDALVNLLSDS